MSDRGPIKHLGISVTLFRPEPRSPSIEDLFLDHYADLVRAALAIAGDRREAEDLVQDAFVRILLARRDLADVEHVDAYLRAVLRNLHTARMRRQAQRGETPLSMADYDSAAFVARALPASDWVHARQALRAACEYACARCLTSKTASLFLLRFFHEYLPGEIGQVARLRRDGVDTGIARGRVEVRAFLDDPTEALRSVGLAHVPVLDLESTLDQPADDYLATLRAAIFGLRHARCFEPPVLRSLYDPSAGPVPTDVLAQLVTCPYCLDSVNRIIKLPPLTERHPADVFDLLGGPDDQARAFWVGTRHERRSRRAAADHWLRAVRAHRPQRLRVLVNGFEVGTHEVNGPTTRATQAVSLAEPIRLVELYSEQTVCLASLDVAFLPEASVEQGCQIELADGRRAELGLSFLTPWPTLRVVYEDPSYVPPADLSAAWDEASAAPSVPREKQEHGRATADGTWRSGLLNLFRVRPSYAGWVLVAAVVGWLFFFTPGTSVSAAERLWHAVVGLVRQLVGDDAKPSPLASVAPSSAAHDIELPAPVALKRTSVAASAPSAATLAELEVDALTVLQEREALVGQRIHVTRTPTQVSVNGLVEGPNRHVLIEALRAVPHGRALQLALRTPEELAGTTQPRGAGRVSVRTVTVDGGAIPAADDLRAYVLAAGAGATGSDVDREIQRLANDGLRRSRAALLEALTLENLAERYDAQPADTLGAATLLKWQRLLAAQADRVAIDLQQLRLFLEPIFRAPPLAASVEAATTPDASDAAGHEPPAAWSVRAQQIGAALIEIERGVRSALAAADTRPPSVELRSPAFWRRATNTEQLLQVFKRQFTTP